MRYWLIRDQVRVQMTYGYRMHMTLPGNILKKLEAKATEARLTLAFEILGTPGARGVKNKDVSK